MESFFSRYRNSLVLMVVLFIQIIALATQVKRPDPRAANGAGARLVRIWAVGAITPVERALVSTGHFFRDGWGNYVDLHNVRRRNRELQSEVDHLRMEQARLFEDAEQGRRLQALLGFKEQFIAHTVAAQVIGGSGSDQSHLIYLDKGSRDGLKADMPVITPAGVVGKVKEVLPLTAQVLMISDRDSGAGIILRKARIEGILRGSSQGELQIIDIMADEKVEPGDEVLTSGGDRIYPKGLPVGTITTVVPDHENPLFLSIQLKPAVDLERVEEVLVVTKIDEAMPGAAEITSRARAADILAQRLPMVPKAPDNNAGASSLAAQPAHPFVGPSIAPDSGAPRAAAAPTPVGNQLTPSRSIQSQHLKGSSTSAAGSSATGTVSPGLAAQPRKPASLDPGASAANSPAKLSGSKPAKPVGDSSKPPIQRTAPSMARPAGASQEALPPEPRSPEPGPTPAARPENPPQ